MTPEPVTTVEGAPDSPYLLLCEHASAHIPADYAGLGLGPVDLRRHIAWDIGAAALARLLARGLGAPLILSGYSRLLIDCNRPLLSSTSIPERSEDTVIPGNIGLDRAERDRRAAAFYTPFQDRVVAELDRRGREAVPTIVFGVHSFTPVFHGVARPWHAGVLYAAAAPFAQGLVAALAADPALTIGDNEPYRIDPEYDHTVPVHGDARATPAALLEVRQDLVADDPGVAQWAARLIPLLAALATHARPPTPGRSR